jgi:hypothetical protein
MNIKKLLKRTKDLLFTLDYENYDQRSFTAGFLFGYEETKWINARIEQPKLNEYNYSENVLAICNGQLMIMCYCYNPSECEEEAGFFWTKCSELDGDCEMDDEEYDVTHWQYLPSIKELI